MEESQDGEPKCWNPFNFETATRRDMIRSGIVNEVEEAGYKNIGKHSVYKGIFQTVTGEKIL